MRCAPLAFTSLAALLLLSSCESGINATASYNPGYGPFDKNGNYVEAWADMPAKEHKWAQSSSKPADSPQTTKPKELPTVASNSRSTKPPGASSTPPPPRTASRPSTSRPTSRPPSRPKPPAVVSAPTSKPKPKPAPKPMVRHVVRKGDTLYGLSRKYGTSVSAIQRANGLSGTVIQLGKTIKIPR